MDNTPQEAVKAIVKAIKATHRIEQVKAHYHYRGPLDLTNPDILATEQTIRKALAPDNKLIYVDYPSLLEVMLLKLYQLGQENGIESTITRITNGQAENWKKMEFEAPALADLLRSYYHNND